MHNFESLTTMFLFLFLKWVKRCQNEKCVIFAPFNFEEVREKKKSLPLFFSRQDFRDISEDLIIKLLLLKNLWHISGIDKQKL